MAPKENQKTTLKACRPDIVLTGTKKEKIMKRKINRPMMLALAALISMSMLAGCGQKAAAETNAASDIIIESEAERSAEAETVTEEAAEKESEVSVDKVQRFPSDGTDETEAEEYIDMQPVAKWGQITSVDEEGGHIYFNSNEFVVDEDGNASEVVNEIVLNITSHTPILDAATLMPVKPSDINTESNVYVWVSQAMTMSLPPQTAAQAIIVNVPEDASAPQYVVVKDVEETEDGVIFTDQDGVKWRADADTVATPYLTRNIVTIADIKVGTRLILTQGSETSTEGSEKAEGADAYAATVMIFAG